MIIFFTGHGILIPIFGLIGLFGGTFLAGAIAGVVSRGNAVAIAGAGMIGGSVGAALMVWLYALTMGRTVEQTYLDPATRRPVTVRKKHTLFFIPAFAWAVIVSVGAVFFSVSGAHMCATSKAGRSGGPGSADAAGSSELREAERLISTNQNGVTHGNSPEARQLAESFSKIARTMREAMIEKGKSSTFSVSGGEFLTYCRVSEHGTAFLMHVPDLRKFTDEAKDIMATAAWRAAQSVALSQTPRPQSVAVAIRGVLLYEGVMVGDPPQKLDGKLKASKPTVYHENEADMLRPFFASPTLAITLPSEERMNAVANAAGNAVKASPSGDTATPAPVAAAAASPAPPAPAITAAPVLPTAVRDWKSSDGRPLRASLVRFTDDTGANAEFKREDGVAFTIPVEKFSAEDKAELQRIFAASKEAPKP